MARSIAFEAIREAYGCHIQLVLGLRCGLLSSGIGDMRHLIGSILACFWTLWGVSFAVAQTAPPNLTLSGSITGKDHQTYVEVPFDVPQGVERLSIVFEYTGKEARTVIDLGLSDPNGLRGWSGGNKSTITIASSDATPSYVPGPVVAGQWKLILGVPNIRSGVTANYKAHITFGKAGDPLPRSAFKAEPTKATAGWYRGDFHSHTGHSDGTCDSLSGRRIPCPAFRTLEAARTAKLDFISVTEHNAASHHSVLRELQAYYDTLLIIPGREITTFFGHMNAIGPTEPLEFQLGSDRLPKVGGLVDKVRQQGGIISINHPGMPSGEDCMGCGYVVRDVDYSRFDAVEIANGGTMHFVGSAEGQLSHIPFWENLLNQGIRITGLGGSDSHDPDAPITRQFPVGRPTTVVYATELSQKGILDGVRSGRVFVDLTGQSNAHLDLSAAGPGSVVVMGGALSLRPGESGELTIDIRDLASGQVQLVLGRGAPDIVLQDRVIDGEDRLRKLKLPYAPAPYWVRVNVRDVDGKLMLISNPVYLLPK